MDLTAADNDTQKRITGIQKSPESFSEIEIMMGEIGDRINIIIEVKPPYKESKCDFLFNACDTELILEKEFLR